MSTVMQGKWLYYFVAYFVRIAGAKFYF